jgi:eukaryotic-like serine/threonine-protein kinase
MVEARRRSDPEFIGPYRVMTRLGGGGFGTVYACTHQRDGELAAVKLVHPYLSESQEFRARFRKEIEGIKRVRSEYVPRLLDEQSSGDPAWLAAELIPGPSLAKVIELCGPLPLAGVWCLGLGMAEALTAIHEARLVHRDLKPQNVLLVPQRPWIIDFGLVHLSDLPHQSMSRLPIATYQYAAPEQLRYGLRGAEAPADIYALGATLLYAASGHAPHEAETTDQLFIRAQRAEPNIDGVPAGLRDLVRSCLHRSPELRPSLAEARAELARHAGSIGDGTGLAGFPAVLPSRVLALLGDFQRDLAAITRARGPARLGWGAHWELGPDAPAPLPSLDSIAASPTIPEDDLPTVAGQRTDDPTLPPGRAAAGDLDERPGASADGWPRRSSPGAMASPAGLGSASRRARSSGVGAAGAAGARADGSWRYRLGGWTTASATVSGGYCVVARLDGTVFGFRAADQSELWPPAFVGAPINDAPVLMLRESGTGGDALVAAADGTVHAISLATGEPRTALAGEAPVAGPLAAAAGRVFALLTDGSLYRVAGHDTDPTWLAQLAEGGSGALMATDDVVIAADTEGVVHVIDAVTGEPRGQVRTEGRVLGSPAVRAGRLFVASTDGILHAAGIGDGCEPDSVRLGDAPIHASLTCDDRTVYIGGSDGLVHAYWVDATGRHGLERRWAPRAIGDEISGLAAADGDVYVAAGYRVIALDAATGEPTRKLLQMNCLVAGAPVISERFCYAVGLGGYLHRVPLDDRLSL